jgi:hypothetical protein
MWRSRWASSSPSAANTATRSPSGFATSHLGYLFSVPGSGNRARDRFPVSGRGDRVGGALGVSRNPPRQNSEASFAALCGVSPIRRPPATRRRRVNRGGDRRATGLLRSSSRGSRSCGTFAADTPNSESTRHLRYGSPGRSANSLKRSDRGLDPHLHAPADQLTQLCHLVLQRPFLGGGGFECARPGAVTDIGGINPPTIGHRNEN